MIEIKNLHKAFGQNQVLKGVDITVNKGDVQRTDMSHLTYL